METLKRNKERILDYLNNYASERQLLSLHNTMCSNRRSDDEIYNNDEEFFNMMFENKPNEAVRAVSYGNYNYMDKFVQFNGYGNLDTFNSIEDSIDLGELADDMLENEDDYDGDIEFEDLFDVVIVDVEDDTFGIYEESGQCVIGEFDSYEEAKKWIEENDDYNLVEGFNV